MSHTAFQHFRPQDYRRMPWKNGGGTTTELIIEPPGTSLDRGFQWRLSMAEVGVSGPFSSFEGCDRTLLLLEGRGMRLVFDQGEPAQLDRRLQHLRFSGDLCTTGTLRDGPCRDFNVITRRDQCSHWLEVLALDARPRPLAPARVRFVFCLAGTLRVGPMELASQELLRVEGIAEPLEAQAPGSALAIVVGIDPVGGDWC